MDSSGSTDLAARVADEARRCRHCEAWLPHAPRPVLRVHENARLLVIGQAPGRRVHETGVPWNDASGQRLRAWLALDDATFYDAARVAILPMGLCYPGTHAGGDLPPRPECAPLWHARVRATLPRIRLTLLVGGYAQRYYLDASRADSMTATVRAFRGFLPNRFPLPHPSWRNTGWLRRNPWFEEELLPVLRERVLRVLAE